MGTATGAAGTPRTGASMSARPRAELRAHRARSGSGPGRSDVWRDAKLRHARDRAIDQPDESR